MTTLTMSVPRMTRAAWYRHRAAILGTVGLFLAAAALLVIDGVVERRWLSSRHLTGCLAAGDASGISRCEPGGNAAAWADFLDNGRPIVLMAVAWSLAAMAGLFAGLPWVAREFESGVFRFTLAQSVSSRRWLLGAFGPLTLLAVVCAALYGLAAQWWHQVAQWRSGSAVTPWDWGAFELTPLSMASWTLLAMALALFLGVTIRRIVPAMLVFVGTAGACVAVTELWLQSHLFAIGALSKKLGFPTDARDLPAWGSHIIGDWWTGPNGQRLADVTVARHINWSSPGRWLAEHHVTHWVGYQPHSRLVWFELARNGILILVAALLVLASAWWLRKHPAE